MNLKPLGDNVIVKQAAAETQTKSGLYVPEAAKEKPQRGEVLAVGAGRLNNDGERMPMDVKVGDTVIYSKYGGNDVKIEDEEYIILKSDQIYAVVEG
ncbi:MAG: co-chaperone GroES [Coriobacteriia bacterium]|nr:co-chaperone GroES [Coriobacteriia bacterium]MCL2870448.1 co-chaperone GroES [Coriobacteriia bacterium]